jgi:hypothetical protein
MYFEMLKRGLFKIDLLKEFAVSLSKAVSNYSPDKAVKIINYKDDSIQSEELVRIFNEEIIFPILDKLVPKSEKLLKTLFEDHRKWHFSFIFPIYFN